MICATKSLCHTALRVPTLLQFLRGKLDGFGGLVVSILASGNRVRGFKPDRSRWIFRASGKSSVAPLEMNAGTCWG